MSGESGWTLAPACPAARAAVQTADGGRPVRLGGPVVIDPAVSPVWAALIIFPPLLSAQNRRHHVSKQKAAEFTLQFVAVASDFAAHVQTLQPLV